MGELAPLLIYHAAWGMGRDCSTFHSLLAADGRSGPWVMIAEGLDLPLSVCSIQKNRHCNLPGQHNGAAPAGGGTGEPSQRL